MIQGRRGLWTDGTVAQRFEQTSSSSSSRVPGPFRWPPPRSTLPPPVLLLLPPPLVALWLMASQRPNPPSCGRGNEVSKRRGEAAGRPARWRTGPLSGRRRRNVRGVDGAAENDS